MSFYNNRMVLKQNIFTVPATKSAGAMTLSSDVINVSTIGYARPVLKAADASKITNNITVKAMGSFDGGTTWMVLGSYTNLANGAGAIYAVGADAKYAPLMRFDMVFDATGALTAGHGINVDVVLVDAYQANSSRKFFSNAWTGYATQAISTTNYSSVLSTSGTDFIENARFALSWGDFTKKTGAAITAVVQGSIDGTNWYPVSVGTTPDVDGASVVYFETADNTFIGKYVRVGIVTDGSSTLTSGHGINISGILEY